MTDRHEGGGRYGSYRVDCTQVLFVRVRNNVAHLTPIISVTGSSFVVNVKQSGCNSSIGPTLVIPTFFILCVFLN
jgi:hypothetical protein